MSEEQAPTPGDLVPIDWVTKWRVRAEAAEARVRVLAKEAGELFVLGLSYKDRAEAAEAALEGERKAKALWIQRALAAEAALAEANEAANRWQTNYEAAAEAAHKLSVKYTVALDRIGEMREALRIIAGERQCTDNLMSNVEVARAALAQHEKAPA